MSAVRRDSACANDDRRASVLIDDVPLCSRCALRVYQRRMEAER